jgi:hypothetical protein
MRRLRLFGFLLGTFAVTSVGLEVAQAATDCQFTFQGRTMALQNDCTTDQSILIPDGFTLDGQDFTIRPIDSATDGFRGAVVRNAGARANVRDLRIDASSLATSCDAAGDRLRGIALVGASGFIVENVVSNINQSGGDGCQEGFGIDAENLEGGTTNVFVQGNTIDAYQKIGIRVSGGVRAVVRENRLTGFGPVDFIAQIGIEVGAGASGTVITRNVVRNNSYTGTQTVQGAGIRVSGGPVISECPLAPDPCPFTTDVVISHNVLTENDVGVLLQNRATAEGLPPDFPTRNLVLDNFIFKAAVTNGNRVQVGISDVGNRDRIIGNTIRGDGYDPAANSGAFTVPIFAEPPTAVDPLVRRNRLP